MKTLTLIDGQEVAAIGQGTWHIGEQPGERKRGGRGAARRHRAGG
ncbi:oxidoreductase [Pseudomonas aeruginosa]|nr:oxidoreductase [Pseudomonas aeruginosa]